MKRRTLMGPRLLLTVACALAPLVVGSCDKKASQEKAAGQEKTANPKNAKMIIVCTGITKAITANKGKCAQMGTALEAVMKPQLALVKAYQAAAISKKRGHPFASAEKKCNRMLPVKVLNTFWACRSDPKVKQAFRDMNSLKP
jgi:fructose-specific component phosphotransferase system IIB-like protein